MYHGIDFQRRKELYRLILYVSNLCEKSEKSVGSQKFSGDIFRAEQSLTHRLGRKYWGILVKDRIPTPLQKQKRWLLLDDDNTEVSSSFLILSPINIHWKLGLNRKMENLNGIQYFIKCEWPPYLSRSKLTIVLPCPWAWPAVIIWSEMSAWTINLQNYVHWHWLLLDHCYHCLLFTSLPASVK